jgi:chromosome segregation ATPase
VSLVTAPELDAPVNDWTELLQSDSKGLEELFGGLFDDMEAMARRFDEQREFYERRCQKIESEKQQLTKALAERPATETTGDTGLQSQVAQLEHDCKTLADELEAARKHAADLAQNCQQLEAEKEQLSASLAEHPSAEPSADPQMQSRVAELEQGHKLLEEELKKVRSRASDLAESCQRLEDEKQQLSTALAEQSAAQATVDPVLQSKVGELEQDREALEEELEEVRNRAADLAKTVNEQKRQMADERAEWSSELRQMRRVLDKQASWIAQQSRQPGAYVPGPGETPIAPTMPAQTMSGQPAAVSPNGYPAPAPLAANRDPVLGSVLTQFELLRKDLERRRAPPKAGGSKNVNAS